MRITDEEFDDVMAFLDSHKEKPFDHENCEVCDFMKNMTNSHFGQALAERSANSTEFLDRIFFLYCGIMIGRNQGTLEDLYGG